MSSPSLQLTDAGSAGEIVERRRGLRIAQHRAVKVFLPAAGRYFGGRTWDVSTTGLRLEVPPSMPLTAGRLVEVYLGGGSGESLMGRRQMIPARVIWMDRAGRSDENRVMVGIEFVQRAAAVGAA